MAQDKGNLVFRARSTPKIMVLSGWNHTKGGAGQVHTHTHTQSIYTGINRWLYTCTYTEFIIRPE